MQEEMVGYDKLVSILVPTRKRTRLINQMLTSVYQTATNIGCVEVLVRFDGDDENSLAEFLELPIVKKFDVKEYVSLRYRYLNLHEYHNELCFCASGEFVFGIADDCIIRTRGWDDVIRQYSGQVVVLRSNVQGASCAGINACPIVSKKIIDILGHFSLSAHSDNYIQAYSSAVGIVRNVDILIERDISMDDEVQRDRDEDAKISSPKYNSPEIQRYVKQDIEKLREALL